MLYIIYRLICVRVCVCGVCVYNMANNIGYNSLSYLTQTHAYTNITTIIYTIL